MSGITRHSPELQLTWGRTRKAGAIQDQVSGVTSVQLKFRQGQQNVLDEAYRPV